MGEDSLFIVNIEHYFIVLQMKKLLKTQFYCLFSVYVSVGEEKKMLQLALSIKT